MGARWFAALTLSVSMGAADAAVIEVQVLANRFQPEAVQVEAGDTVRWSVVAGRHRLRAAPDSPLVGLDSGPLQAGQSYSFRFQQPGDVYYLSDAVDDMTGAVSVTDVPADFIVDEAISAGWYDPAADGQGLLFEYVPSTNTVVALWFTFALSGGDQLWLIGTAQPTGHRVTLQMLAPIGGRINDPRAVEKPVWGELTVDFSDCDNARAWFNNAADGASGEIPLSRLYLGELCERRP